MLCFPEVFQQIITGIKLILKMQRTENEFDAERRILEGILEASRTRDMASLVPRVLSNPPYGESNLFYDLCKAVGTQGTISSNSEH